MASSPELLSKLHDIHPPPPVSWWPLAPGWWVVAAVIVATALYLLLKRRRGTWRTHALRELQKLENEFNSGGDTVVCITRISVLLRRTALTVRDPASVAGLTGDAWLKFLDESGQTQEFTTGAGRVLVDAPYARAPAVSAPELIHLARHWLRAAQ